MHAIEWRLLDAGMRATNHDGIEWVLRVLGMVFWTIRRVYGVLGAGRSRAYGIVHAPSLGVFGAADDSVD